MTSRTKNYNTIAGAEEEEEFTPCLGMTIKQTFRIDGDDETFGVDVDNQEETFEGVVVLAPHVDDENPDDEDYNKWTIEYDDSETHKFTAKEMKEMVDVVDISDIKDKCIRKRAVKLLNPRTVPLDINAKYTYDDAKRELLYLMGMTEADVIAALGKMKGPTYGLNEAMNLIHKARNDSRNSNDTYKEEPTGYFVPKPGTRLRVCMKGSQYHGTVTKQTMRIVTIEVPHFEIMDDDGDKEDMTLEEVGHWRACRPIRPNPCRSRVLHALEMFSGKSMVAQEFHKKLWSVRSFDIDPKSHATDKVDILNIRFANLGMVPDFIWASILCHTYSNLAAGVHRSPKDGLYEKTDEAHLNNRYFVRMAYIMLWAKKLNPHLIVVIENPVGVLPDMPLMKELEKRLKLKKVKINYCQFGRKDQKPTYLWTNDIRLRSELGDFTCTPATCKHYKKHPVGTQTHKKVCNTAAIPQGLAEEVAAWVDFRMLDQHIHKSDPFQITQAHIDEFDSTMKKASKAEVIEIVDSDDDDAVRAVSMSEVSIASTGDMSSLTTTSGRHKKRKY